MLWYIVTMILCYYDNDTEQLRLLRTLHRIIQDYELIMMTLKGGTDLCSMVWSRKELQMTTTTFWYADKGLT